MTLPRPLSSLFPESLFPESSLQRDAVVRATGVLGLGAVAVVHVAQLVPTTEQSAWLGAAFVVLVLVCVGMAGVLLHRGNRRVWVGVAAINLLAIGGYMFTRLFSTGLDNADVGNWSENLGVTALFVEGILVLLSLHAMIGWPRPRSSDPLLVDVTSPPPIRSHVR